MRLTAAWNEPQFTMVWIDLRSTLFRQPTWLEWLYS